MKTILLMAIAFCLGGLVMWWQKPAKNKTPISTTSERAYQQRETIDYARIRPWAIPIGEDFIKQQRHKNFFENSEKFPLVRDVVQVQVMPTADGGLTVSLIDVDGRICTLWVTDGQLPPRKPLVDGAHQMYSSEETVFAVSAITSY